MTQMLYKKMEENQNLRDKLDKATTDQVQTSQIGQLLQLALAGNIQQPNTSTPAPL